MNLISPARLALLVLSAGSAVVAVAAEAPTRLPEFFVSGGRIGALEITLPKRDLQPPEANLGRELLAIPGVYGHARAADAMEPSIRGLGLDRVSTTFNGLPLSNASPERTNSPVVILGPAAVGGITVTKALPSVTLGPVTTGGNIALSSVPPAEGSGERPMGGELTSTYNGSRDGFTTAGRWHVREGSWRANLSFFRNSLGDYDSASGRQVASRLDEYGASAGLGLEVRGHQIEAEYLHRRLRLQETLSLPLDGRNTDTDVMTLKDHWTIGDAGLLQAVDWRVGGAVTDPYITSELRPVPSVISALATARSFGAGMSSLWRGPLGGRMSVGADYSRQTRRAVRTTPAGKDYIWPGVRYTDTGAFAEWRRPLSAAWRLRLGARADDVRSEARDADQLALGRPLREQFVAYNGPAAATSAHRDHAGAANVLLEWVPGPDLTGFVGTGWSVQPAQATERYRAFLNALGGDGRGGPAVELGNPALASEQKSAIEAGGTLRRPWVDLEATVYYYRIDDFIVRKPVGTTRPPLASMIVFGYRNADCDFSGAEMGVTLKPAADWRVPVTFAIAEGRTRAGGDLPEIPPWEATAAVRYQAHGRMVPVVLEFGGRLVAAKDNPAPLDNPLFANTGGFAVWHARAGLPLRGGLKVEFGVENLFDRAYSEYLSPPVGPFRPASGNLVPGERIPSPGRSLWLSLTMAW